MSADPRVMEYFPALVARPDAEASAGRIAVAIRERGYGLWAAEVKGGAPFIGFIGVQPVPADLPFAPALEVGWRLAAEFWGHGYATEGARAAIGFAFAQLGVAQVVAMTAVGNLRSRRVMERLHMTYEAADDFGHPRIPSTSPIHPHVLYRLRCP